MNNGNGLYFDDLYEGQTFVSVGRTVTETDVVSFAGLSGDFNPIHLDAESAKLSIYGQRVAHGVLGTSIITGLIDSLGLFRRSMIAMLGIDEWKFLAPIFIGDTVHIELSIAHLRLTSKGDRGVVKRLIKLIKQDGTVVQQGFITVMVRSRAEASVATGE